MQLHLDAIALLLASSLLSVPAIAQERPAPSLSAAPAVTDAPGSGIQPGVSGHSATLPVLYQLDQQPIEQISPLVQRQYLVGAQSTFVKWTVKKGGVFSAAPSRQRTDHLDYRRAVRGHLARQEVHHDGGYGHGHSTEYAA